MPLGDVEPSDFELDAFPPPPDEPSTREKRGRLRLLEELARSTPPVVDEASVPDRLGRFRLLERIGKGGMGSVYRAEDMESGSIVAVKVLNASWSSQPGALDRFRKEARVLAEVNNPYVTNLLEFGEDGEIPYLALEFVTGMSLGRLLKERGRLGESAAVAIIADVARALVEAHERGIVHRDIKPENILIVEPKAIEVPAWGSLAKSGASGATRVLPGVKLSDFGLARHVLESESLQLTLPGKVLGTPFYMSPEQCAGGTVGPGSDVYAMGATLFHLLAGRPPFEADDAMALLSKHRFEEPPTLRGLDPTLGERISLLVSKALAKSPDWRHPNAGAFLDDLERLARGEPTSVMAHPTLPACDPSEVVEYLFRWDLAASPPQLWPFVSDTERLNRAVGLPPVTFTTRDRQGPGVRRFGKLRKLGLTASWEEHPFEWVEGRRMGVLREYDRGPFAWLASVVELAPTPSGGTLLTHHVRLRPRGLWGRALSALEVKIRGRRALDRVYRRIDATLALGTRARSDLDPFEEQASPAGERRRRLDRLVGKLAARGVSPASADRLGDFLAHAAPQELARIRPLALARRWELEPKEVTAACLHAASEGLLVLGWDLICPACRISSEVKDSLRALRDHGHCAACRLDYPLDFAHSVEMIFRSHPAIRAPELGTYCLGGPAHSPHVVAQARVAPGERIELALALPQGTYRVRSAQLTESAEFRVEPGASVGRWVVDLSGMTPVLKPDGQLLAYINPHDWEVVLRVERTAAQEDALTAAKASSLALFRELFPSEILSPGQLVAVSVLTFLLTELDQAPALYEALGDARAFGVIHEHFRLLDDAIRREGGALVKTAGDGIVAAFDEPTAAVRVGLALPTLLRAGTSTGGLKVRAVVHKGPAMAATLNDNLDYFGQTLRQAARLLRAARGGDLILGPDVAHEPNVAALLESQGIGTVPFRLDLPGRRDGNAYRLATTWT